MRRGLVLVATSPSLAHGAWMAWHRLARTHVVMIGPPGQLAGAMRIRVTALPRDTSGAALADALPPGDVVACDERAHVRLLEAGVRLLGHGDAALIRTIADKASYPALAERCGFQTPAVLDAPQAPGRYIQKPRWGFGGEGVDEWRPGDRRLPASIVMPFIEGDDVDASLAAVDGHIIASTAERSLGPGMRAYYRDDVVEAAAASVARGLDYTGLLHIDMRVGPDGVPWIVDINPRIWASHWMAQSAGMDIAGTWLKAMRGEPYRFTHKAGVVAPPWRFMQARRHGRPALLAPLRAAGVRWADPGVLRAMRHFAAHPPHTVRPWPTQL